jgi:hypothetical protein
MQTRGDFDLLKEHILGQEVIMVCGQIYQSNDGFEQVLQDVFSQRI